MKTLNIKHTKRWSDTFQTYEDNKNYLEIILNFLANTRNANILTSVSAIGGFLLLIML